jgi:hypothetical protein
MKIINICIFIFNIVTIVFSLDDNDNLDHYKKINGISKIVWINLERSVERRARIENELSHINIPNRRIQAVDGLIHDVSSYFSIHNDKPHITTSETACVLSHFKAIHSLTNIEGDYFLILEDDSTFENVKYIPFTLQEIIRDAPPFDILKIHSCDNSGQTVMYHLCTSKCCCSSSAYVISRSGIQTLQEKIHFKDNVFIFNYKDVEPADFILFYTLKTYTYKYDYITTTDIDSTIHPDHIENHHKPENKRNFHKIQSDFGFKINTNGFLYGTNAVDHHIFDESLK